MYVSTERARVSVRMGDQCKRWDSDNKNRHYKKCCVSGSTTCKMERKGLERTQLTVRGSRRENMDSEKRE